MRAKSLSHKHRLKKRKGKVARKRRHQRVVIRKPQVAVWKK